CNTLPKARDHVLADAGHMLPVTHADACAKLADAFYSGL
ncbi:MAG: alpha/beta hydrolase, partial [Rhodobacteraceae bacterium]|nr:alpha/beta hydrolase [Paracoccaceae bacterium]